MHLTVKTPFGEYQTGDIITDEETIANILGSEYAAYVLRTPAQTPAAQPAEG